MYSFMQMVKDIGDTYQGSERFRVLNLQWKWCHIFNKMSGTFTHTPSCSFPVFGRILCSDLIEENSSGLHQLLFALAQVES